MAKHFLKLSGLTDKPVQQYDAKTHLPIADDFACNYVVGGAFSAVGTHGLPLEVVLMFFKDNNWVVDWVDYVNGALKDGHNLSTVRSRIFSAVGDVYGPKYRDAVIERFDKFFGELHAK